MNSNSSTSDSDAVVADTLAWSLTAFAYATDPADDTWTNAFGKQIRFSGVIESAIAVLERGTKTLQSAMLDPRVAPTADRVHDFACAGTHLIYGLATCLKLGHCTHGLPERMKPQFDILIWRLENDLKLIDSYYDNLGADYPADVEQMYRLDTKLKFLGHAFETINSAHQYNLFEPTATQQELIARGRQGLTRRCPGNSFGGNRKIRGKTTSFSNSSSGILVTLIMQSAWKCKRKTRPELEQSAVWFSAYQVR